MPMSNQHQTLALPAHPADGTELTLSVLGCGTFPLDPWLFAARPV